MASRPDAEWGSASRWAAIVASIALWFVTLGTAPSAILAWLAPMPIFALAGTLSVGATFCVAFATHAVGGLALWPYLHGVIGAPAPVAVLAIAGPSLLFALTATWARLLLTHVRPWFAAIGSGACAAALDLALATFSVHGSFGSIAYTQLPFPAVTQLAALGGTHAIVFVMATVGAAAGFALVPPPQSRRGRRASATLAIGLLATTLVGGIVRLARASDSTGTLRVALLAADTPRTPPAASSDAGRALIERYERAVRALPRGGHDVIVLPERIVDLDENSEASWSARWAAAATDRGGLLVTGAAAMIRDTARNTAFVSAVSAERPSLYFKEHLLPPFELRFSPGTDLVVNTVGTGHRAGVMICKDADFAALGRRYAHAGIQALLVPAWDFGVDGELHARMAMMRGIEGGYAVVRSARSGLLSVSDGYGRLIASLPSNSPSGMAMLRAKVPLHRLRTPYAQWGNAFGVACLAFTLLTGAALGASALLSRGPTANTSHRGALLQWHRRA